MLLGSGHQVNYEFHDELSPELVPGLIAGYRGKADEKKQVPHA